MTDREKVIKGFECCQYSSKSHCDGCQYNYEGLCDTNDCTADLASDALALLKEQKELTDHYQSLLIAYNDMRKEQEPKPIAYTDNPYTGLPVARCPKCGKFARQFHSAIKEETHYCPWCGQAVKWE